MKDLKELKHFLITRFMQIVVACALAEAIIFYTLGNTVFRWLLFFFFRTDEITDIGLSQIGLAVPVVIAGTLVSLAGYLLPDNMLRPLEVVLGTLNRTTLRIFELPVELAPVIDMSLSRRLFFTVCIVATVFLILLPYAIAAMVFSKIVVREFKSIEDRERMEREEHERRRNLMLSDIAHDLRTPMTTVAGYARALDDDLIPEERKKEICTAIQTKTKRMSDLIDLLFDYVKLDSEGFALNKESLDICELVRECAAFMYQDIEDAGMELDIDVPEEPILINADRIQMSRVITNLISNAVRHNGQGTVIGVYIKREDDIGIMICDSGQPIEKEYAAHIFEPFVTSDESRNSRGGSGLGLSIAAKIIKMHGFSIRLVQKPDLAIYRIPKEYVKMFIIRIKEEA